MSTAQHPGPHPGASPNTSSPRQIISSLLAALPPAPQSSANPLRDLSSEGETKNILLTLYTLFEKELLPALDLLDRGLVSRLIRPAQSGGTGTALLLVRSAQQSSNSSARHSGYEHVNYYDVRLDAWSCSCPAFTFAAFPATAASCGANDDTDDEGKCLFGGLTRGSDVAVCKHLLACLLVQHCEMFARFAEEKEVSLGEIAGWAAGWGD